MPWHLVLNSSPDPGGIDDFLFVVCLTRSVTWLSFWSSVYRQTPQEALLLSSPLTLPPIKRAQIWSLENLSEARMFLLILLSAMLQWKISIAFWLFILSKDQSEKKSSRHLHPTTNYTLRISALFCEIWAGSDLWTILVYWSSVLTLYYLYGANWRSLFDRVSFLLQKFVSTIFEKFSEYHLH